MRTPTVGPTQYLTYDIESCSIALVMVSIVKATYTAHSGRLLNTTNIRLLSGEGSILVKKGLRYAAT